MMAAPVQAVIHYSCDFETQAQRDRWVLNPTANQTADTNLKNRWYIGKPGNNGKTGQNGLFISDDNGASAHYRNNGCWNYAYDTVSLDYMATGDYTLVFDYCVMANVASNFDGLYVLWAPMLDEEGDSIKWNSIPGSTGTVPTECQNYIIQLQPTANIDYLNGTSTWKQCAVKIKGKKCDGTPHYLVFVWTNGSKQAQQPSAMVDNINISDNIPCDPVTGLTATPNGNTITLNWNQSGSMTDYEVSAYSYETGTWSGPKLVTGTTTQFTGLPIGQTDFIVRTKCSDTEFSLKTIVSQLIYYPDQMCVDYLDLSNAVCYVDNSAPDNTLTFNDFKQVPAVDYGPSNIKSRHVVHFDRSETEPRTGGQAKTIPDGELASIRLGNWEAENHAERIEFTFEVDTIKYPVLLLKYLPILEAPGHDDHENPRFKLDMLINGQTIGRCGQADFNCNDVYAGSSLKPGASDQGWHITKSSVAQTSADIVWKDWTTVGVNLRKSNYQGKKITIRLTTHDCTFSAHCGYAYFTLGCSDGKLKGMKCGQINEIFEAPEGFNYRWIKAENEVYRRVDGSVPEQYVCGRGKTYEAGRLNDTLYVVDCMFVQDSTCFFSLYASTLATNPISVIDHKVIRNCQEGTYKVQFDGSKSWVQEIDHVIGDTLVSKAYHIESYQWIVDGLPDPYNWSNDTIHTFEFPIEGGDYTVKLVTTCGTCSDTAVYQLHLDPLGPTHETQTIVLCDADRKTGYHWAERTGALDTLHFDYGLVDSVKLFNEVSSCDSFIYLELIEPIRILEDTMILPEDLPYTRHGKTYPVGTVSHIDTIPFPTTCDTTWVFNLEVYESLIVEPATSYVLCEGADTITFVYDIQRGRSQSFLYGFTNQDLDTLVNYEQKKGHYEVPVALDPNLEPGLYNGAFKFTDLKPEFSVNVPFTFTMNYAPFVIAQRWNDVLAIRNDTTIRNEYEALWGYKPVYHYEFDSVQWFVSGQPIDSANTFNYYAGEKQQLQFGKEYQALLRRVKDGALIFTCAYIPQPVPTTYTEQPHLTAYTAHPKQALRMRGRGTAEWYDMLGRRHNSVGFDNSDILAPATVGYYLLVLRREDGREINQVLVK